MFLEEKLSVVPYTASSIVIYDKCFGVESSTNILTKLWFLNISALFNFSKYICQVYSKMAPTTDLNCPELWRTVTSPCLHKQVVKTLWGVSVCWAHVALTPQWGLLSHSVGAGPSSLLLTLWPACTGSRCHSGPGEPNLSTEGQTGQTWVTLQPCAPGCTDSWFGG